MPIAGVGCGPPCSGGHTRAPLGGMGSLVQSPYRLVGGERALTSCSPGSLTLVVPVINSTLSINAPEFFPNGGSVCDDGCCGSVEDICCVCKIYKVGGCSHALSRLGPVHSIVALGADLCGSDNVETRVDFGSDSLRRVVVSSPSQSRVLIGSTIEHQVFDGLPCDSGAICASEYNPMMNHLVPFCKSVSDDPSVWYERVISPQLSLEDASLDEIKVFKVSKDVSRIFKEATDDLSQYVQCGFEFLSHILDSKVCISRGIIRECPLKEHCRIFLRSQTCRILRP